MILDSPAMVFQPGEGSREGSSGGREGREYWSRERGELGELYTRENSRDSYWSRENRYLWETSFWMGVIEIQHLVSVSSLLEKL